jgi:hypothetical protein
MEGTKHTLKPKMVAKTPTRFATTQIVATQQHSRLGVPNVRQINTNHKQREEETNINAVIEVGAYHIQNK